MRNRLSRQVFKRPVAFVHNADSPGAHAQAALFGRPAEIEIVEMKVKELIEEQILRQQGLASGCQHHAVQELDLLAGRSVSADVIRRPVLAVRHDPAQIFPVISPEGVVQKSPRRLTVRAAPVAGEADDVEFLKPIENPGRPIEVEQVHVVVNEHEDGGIDG